MLEKRIYLNEKRKLRQKTLIGGIYAPWKPGDRPQISRKLSGASLSVRNGRNGRHALPQKQPKRALRNADDAKSDLQRTKRLGRRKTNAKTSVSRKRRPTAITRRPSNAGGDPRPSRCSYGCQVGLRRTHADRLTRVEERSSRGGPWAAGRWPRMAKTVGPSKRRLQRVEGTDRGRGQRQTTRCAADDGAVAAASVKRREDGLRIVCGESIRQADFSDAYRVPLKRTQSTLG